MVAGHEQQLGPDVAQVHVAEQRHALDCGLTGGLAQKFSGYAQKTAAPLREDLSWWTSEKDTYHNHKFTGLSRIGHVDGPYGFLKVLVCILTLAPMFQEENFILTHCPSK